MVGEIRVRERRGSEEVIGEKKQTIQNSDERTGKMRCLRGR